MPTGRKCPQCGAGLPDHAADGLCVKCLQPLGQSGPGQEPDREGMPDDIPLLPDVPPPEANEGPANTIVVTDPPKSCEQPGDHIGRYKLLQQIGEGGMGTVWMAEQTEPVRRKVALKIVKLGMDTRSVIARFEAERQALALMDHPNIAKVFDAGTTGTGRPYFVMELVRGVRINDFCDQNHLSTAERLGLFVQICHATQHAHQKGIIHRDLKPSNILITLHDSVPVPKVIDFGIAKATSDQRLTDKTLFTAFEQFLGTPAYMSPEQAEMSGLDIDTRTDVYSLGVLLYELLTGRTPFDSQILLRAGLDEMRRILRETDPPRPSTRLQALTMEEATDVARRFKQSPAKLAAVVRGDLDWIVMKCLEKDRTRRYETANGLAADVQRHLSNEPIIARPPGKLYRVQKLVWRNKLSFAAVAAVSILLVLGALSYIHGVRQEQRKTKAALAEAQANFRLARNAMQHAMVGGSFGGNRQDETNDLHKLFMGVYQKARAAQPDDPELLSEYVRLLQARSMPRWPGGTNIQPKDAEANVDEAIALLENAQAKRPLNAEDRYLLAQLCHQRVQLWRDRQPREEQGQKTLPLPPEISRLSERAKSVAEQLAIEKPEEEKFVFFSLESVPLREKRLSELPKHLATAEKFLAHHPDNQSALQHARYAHWQLGKTATNVTEACEHFRRALDLHARLLRAPGYNSNFRYASSPPNVNALNVASALLRSSGNVEVDYAIMTNLLAASEAISKREGRHSRPIFEDAESWERDDEARFWTDSTELTLGLQMKIAYHLVRHGRYDTAVSFVNTRLPTLETSAPRELDRTTPRIRHYLQFNAGIAAIRSGRPADAIPYLEPLAALDMFELPFHGEVGNGSGRSSVPRLMSHLDMRHLAAAALDEAYIATGREKEARDGLGGWFASYDREWKPYANAAAHQRAFALLRLAILDVAPLKPEASVRAREEALNALKQLDDQRLFAIARMAAAAADNSLSAPRRAWFAEAALAALTKHAEAGLLKADDLRSDPDLQPLVSLPAFRELLLLFDRAYESASQKLALSDAIDVGDRVTLSQAAARNAKVRMSGRITAVRTDQEGIQLWLAGKAGGLWVSGKYEKIVPTLMATSKDFTDLVGGWLVFKEQPNTWDGKVSATLTHSNVIESFMPREAIAVTNLTAVAVTNVTASDLGRRLSVLGTLKNIGRWYSGSRSVEVTFAGTRKNGFIAVLPASQKAAFDKRFPLGSSSLTGSTIRLSGVIEVLDGTPQLLISDVQGLEIVTPAPAPELRAANEEFHPRAIPPRDPRAAANLIDLSPYYNAHLDQSWHWGSRSKSDLSALPSGIQKLAGVEFDVRGLIQVGGRSRTQPYSNVVAGLRLERGCRRLHFLQAAINASSVVNGTEIGRYVIHYSNGQSSEIQVTIGPHLAHWRRQSNEVEPKFVVAWMQSEESAAKERKDPARLFKMTWDNPRPGVDIKSIDLIATHQNAAPFLVAITAEP